MKEWGRIVTAMITPMNPDGSVNYQKAVELAKGYVAEGTTAILAAGTTGESPTLTAGEKEELFRLLKKELTVPVIAGTGTNSTAASIENSLRARECGADGLLLVVPYYNKPNQESLYAHFQAVAQAVDLPIMLYNVPGRSVVNMTADTTVALSAIPNIVCVKEASGDLVQAAEIISRAAPGFTLYTGDDAGILPTMAIGGYGVVSVASQVVGPQIKEMIDSYLAGRVEEAAAIHRRLTPIFNKLFMTANPIPLKAALNLMGREVGGTRLPLAPPSEQVVETMSRELTALGIL